MSDYLPNIFKRSKPVQLTGVIFPAGWYVEVTRNGKTLNYGPFEKKAEAQALANKPAEQWGSDCYEL